MIGWQDQRQSLSWTIDVPTAADYQATALLSVDSQVPVMLTVSSAGASSSALFKVDSRGYQSRSTIETPLRLGKGRNVVTLRLTPTPGDAPFQAELLALELTRPTVRAALHQQALETRADVRWMARETFGVGFHWTKRTMPRSGPANPYAQAVADFDVDRFAEQVASTGASFVYLTTSHSDQYLPAPIKALDAILPGRTTSRDLIADLIAALKKRQIKLFLYYHLGPIEDPAWSAATHMWDSNPTRFFANWQTIISEMGARYGKDLAGWWFDDGVYNYYYRSPDWASLAKAAKVGNSERAVCFNSWKAASATEFQDYFCGEEIAPGGLNAFLNTDGSINGTLPEGGDGRIATGQFAGLQAAAMFVVETDWVHTP
ncbi:MAG: alpha-L-fucosidase, partial [Microbacteriaceae bacterium]|nr:alpha-L-fucosidase [Burkholderiaceae bacterium]